MSKLYAVGDNESLELGGRVTDNKSIQQIDIATNKELSSNLNRIKNIHTNHDRTVFVLDKMAFITNRTSHKVTQIPNSETIVIKDVKIGKHHILILTQGGQLYSYGGNDYGQLGYNTPRQEKSEEFETVFYSDKPKSIKPGNTKVIISAKNQNKLTQYQHVFSQIAVGNYHNLALTNTGSVFTWGGNTDNQLGIKADQNNNRYYTKDSDGVVCGHIVELLALRGTPIRQVAACGNTSYILSHSGEVYAFGDNSQGQLGFDSRKSTNVNKNTLIHRVPNLQGKQIIKIAPGLLHCLALTKQKRVYCWGRSDDGQLGVNGLTGIQAPNTQLTNTHTDVMGTNIIDIAAGAKHSVLLTDKGKHISFGKSKLISDYSHLSPTPLKSRKIFAGQNRIFFISEDPNHPTYDKHIPSNDRMDDGEFYDDSDSEGLKFADLDCPVTPITGQQSAYQKEQDKYAYSAVLNMSFLKRDHHETNMKDNSGLDYGKIWEATESWAGKEDKSRENRAIDYITRDLLPSLSVEPPCIEAIRLYMFLPLLPQFKPKTSTVSSIQAEYCISFLNLPNAARKTLRSWFEKDCPKNVLKTIVSRFTECVSLMCEEHSKPNGNISIRTPCNPQNHRSYEITDHPDPTTLVVANRAAVAMLKFLNVLNYVNERRPKSEQLEIEDFYLKQNCLANWDWTDDWTRRCEERQAITEYYKDAEAKKEIYDMDHFNLSFSQRKAFKEREENKQQPDNFDIIDYGFGKHEQFFNLCAYPFCMDPKSKAKVLQIETKTAQEHAHRLTYYQNINATFYSIPQGQDQPVFQLYIDRANIVESTFRNLMCSKPQDFKKPLTVKFANETARDAEANETAGVRREFFMLILAELLSEKNQYGMFDYFKESQHMWFSKCCYEDIAYYQLIGIICGLALYNDNIVDIHFPKALYKMLLGETPDLDDYCELDPVSGETLKKMLDITTEEEIGMWDLTFEVSYDEFGDPKTDQLIDNGSNIPVTLINRKEYIDLVVKHKFKSARSMECFQELEKGFKTVLEDDMGNILNIFRPKELMTVVVGDTKYNWSLLQKHARYSDGYSHNHPNITRFWNVFMSLEEPKKKEFLQFLTGSSKIPISGLQIYFQMDHGGDERLPQAHTCFNLLDLPIYHTEKMMKTKLLQAIENCEGFQFI